MEHAYLSKLAEYFEQLQQLNSGDDGCPYPLSDPTEPWNKCGCPDPSVFSYCPMPDGCSGPDPVTPYCICRLSGDIKQNADNNWVPGDILAVGDSLTDLAKVYGFEPMPPRTLNAGISGSKIEHVIFTLQQIELYFSMNNKPFQPSKLIVLVGTNDLLNDGTGAFNQFTALTQQRYLNLFSYLRQFRQTHNCSIIIRSLPPGKMATVWCNENAPDKWILYNGDVGDFSLATMQASAFLANETSKSENQFTFVDYGQIFYDGTTNSMHENYLTNYGEVPDQLHWGCLGYQIALGYLPSKVFSSFPLGTGSFPSLPSEPHGPPESNEYLVPINYFRYVCHIIPVGATIKVTLGFAQHCYVGIFDPALPGGLPSVEVAPAPVVMAAFSNPYLVACPVIICLGSNSLSVNYSIAAV